jgi:prolipoprotein diacylglyceryltransferase
VETVILSLGNVKITSFGLCVMAAAGACVALLYVSMRKLGKDAWAVFAVWCLPLALLGARLFYCLARINYIVDLYGLDYVWRFWEGGYAFWGAVGGSALAGVICSKRMRLKTSDVLNAATPALLLMLALGRFAEYFGGQGYGPLVENEAWQFFPLALQNVYGEWNISIFIAEGVTALAALALSVRGFQTHKALKSLIVISAAQIVWESMRGDLYLSWGFVRVSQLAAVAVLFVIFSALLVRRFRAGEKPLVLIARLAAFAALTGVCVALEFAMDKSPLPNGWAWLIMAGCAAGLGVLPWKLLRKSDER